MCDLTKISKKTKEAFNKLDAKFRNTDECYRYRLGVNGLNEVCLTDFRTMTDVKGNRNIQNFIKELLKESK